MKLSGKLLEIRKSVEYLQKTEKGNQGAMYVDPAVLIKKIRDKMNEHNILLIPSLHNSTVDSISYPTKANSNATSFLFKSEMIYTFMDTDSEDKLDIPWFITGKHLQDPAMAGGAALTYFERYFLLKFFQIPTSKDDPEYFKDKTKEIEPPKQITIGPQNVSWLIDFCKRHQITDKEDKKKFQDHYGFDPYDTSAKDFELVKTKIEADYNEES